MKHALYEFSRRSNLIFEFSMYCKVRKLLIIDETGENFKEWL